MSKILFLLAFGLSAAMTGLNPVDEIKTEDEELIFPVDVDRPAEDVILDDFVIEDITTADINMGVITTESVTEDGILTQTAAVDLDGDGVNEQITAYFSCEILFYIDGIPTKPEDFYDTCEIKILNGKGEEYSFVWSDQNMFPQIHYADFDVNDKSIQFYLESNGSSADFFTQVFSFDGNQIAEKLSLPDFITSYDGLGRIYTSERYQVNSYYDLNSGFTPLPKENIVGAEISRDFNLLLSEKPGKAYTAAILSSYYEEGGWEEYAEDLPEDEKLLGLVPAGTPLTVLDIFFGPSPWDEGSSELYPVPWLKVRTPEGLEGWFCVIYGD